MKATTNSDRDYDGGAIPTEELDPQRILKAKRLKIGVPILVVAAAIWLAFGWKALNIVVAGGLVLSSTWLVRDSGGGMRPTARALFVLGIVLLIMTFIGMAIT